MTGRHDVRFSRRAKSDQAVVETGGVKHGDETDQDA
jgi:hypothetical protein